MNKQILLLIFCFINSYSYFINAQNQTLINYGDKAKINIYTYNNDTIIYPYIFQDYDNLEDNWLGIIKYKYKSFDSLSLVSIDNDLNIKRIIRNKGQILQFRYSNKNYGLRFVSPESCGDASDSVIFFCNDTSGNNLITKTIIKAIGDSVDLSISRRAAFLSKDKNIILSNYGEKNSKGVLSVYKIDTLGSIIQSKRFWNINHYYYSFYESKNTFDILFPSNLQFLKVYHVDKNTLEIVDSSDFDSVFYPLDFTRITDSIYVVSSDIREYTPGEHNIEINIVNEFTMERKDIKIPIDDVQHTQTYYLLIPEFGQRMDFTNPDSIYFCYFMKNPEGTCNYIDIANFGIGGNLNFRYRIDYDSTTLFKQINGIKATTDGGVIITCVLNSCSWITNLCRMVLLALVMLRVGRGLL